MGELLFTVISILLYKGKFCWSGRWDDPEVRIECLWPNVFYFFKTRPSRSVHFVARKRDLQFKGNTRI